MRARGVHSAGETWKADQIRHVKVTDLDCIQSNRKADFLIIVGHLDLCNDCALAPSFALVKISYLVR